MGELIECTSDRHGRCPNDSPAAEEDNLSKTGGGEMLNNMQCCGVIKESDSPWSSPIVLVRKRNGELCFCVAYRKLIDITKDY
jgi:hypothetical protein